MNFSLTPRNTLAAIAVAGAIIALALAAFLAGRADSNAGSSPVATQVNGLGKGTKTIEEKLKASSGNKASVSKSTRGPRGCTAKHSCATSRGTIADELDRRMDPRRRRAATRSIEHDAELVPRLRVPLRARPGV